MSRPELVVYSNLPILNLFSHFVIQVSLSDYSNDHDLIFNSKEVSISELWYKAQSLLHTDILYFENMQNAMNAYTEALGRLLYI